MRSGPLPSLNELGVGEPVMRCHACGQLVLGEEACTSAEEARVCMAEGVIASVSQVSQVSQVPSSGVAAPVKGDPLWR